MMGKEKNNNDETGEHLLEYIMKMVAFNMHGSIFTSFKTQTETQNNHYIIRLPIDFIIPQTELK